MIICPNLSNPEVAREFEELVQATSEQAAYHIWSLNNGNAIDRAPNGAPSKLFLTLLEHYNGDRTKAIQAKAKTYGNSFLTWFGDWINDTENASKVVDENGEPLVVWHTTHPIHDPSFTIFDTNVTGKKSFIYTTDNLKMSESYAPDESRSKSTGKVVRKWNKEKAEKQIVKDEKAIQDLKDYIERYNKSNNWKEFFNDQSIEESDFEDFSKQKKYEIDGAKNGIKNLEAEIYFLHDLIDHPEKMQYTKALFVNSRTPVVIDAEGNWWNEINVYNGKEGVRQAKYMDNKKTYQRDVTYNYIIKHYGQNTFDEIFEYDIASVDDYLTEKDYEEINKIVNTKYPENYTFESTRTIESSIMEDDNHDGIIIKNVKDYGPGTIYTSDNGTVVAVKEPNQVKSIDNQSPTPYEGTFSRENDDIFDTLKSLGTELMKNCE